MYRNRKSSIKYWVFEKLTEKPEFTLTLLYLFLEYEIVFVTLNKYLSRNITKRIEKNVP